MIEEVIEEAMDVMNYESGGDIILVGSETFYNPSDMPDKTMKITSSVLKYGCSISRFTVGRGLLQTSWLSEG